MAAAVLMAAGAAMILEGIQHLQSDAATKADSW